MSSRIIITDIHGCAKTLQALVAKLPPGIPITVSGDMIDRGPDSKGVIEIVKNSGWDVVLGNHEQMMMDELRFGIDQSGEEYATARSYHSGIWLMNGGDRALDSYEVNGVQDLNKLKEHYEWLKTLPYVLEYPDLKNDQGQALLVTHSSAAGVWSEDHNSDHFKSGVIWSRPTFPKKIDGLYNVYGHTIQSNGKPTVSTHFACIDTGCYVGKPPYGKLTALQFPEMITYVQENVDK